MTHTDYTAYRVEEENGSYTGNVQTLSVENLPAGELLVEVAYSSLNYKDALSARGNKGVTKSYPHTPGIDAAGVVVESSVPEYQAGDSVIVTSHDLGMNTPGGFGGYIRVPAAWAVPLPAGLSLKEAMCLGTAGLTAAICVSHLVERIRPEDGPVAVSGATGGVGSLATGILAQLGYQVQVISGKKDKQGMLKELGAAEVLDRAEFGEESERSMLKGRFAGAVDTVGGAILTNLIKAVKPFGVVSCCGNAAGGDLPLTVYPFILRGIALCGVSSQNYPAGPRRDMWQRLAGDWKYENLFRNIEEIGLDRLDAAIESMLAGTHSGRTVVRHGDQ